MAKRRRYHGFAGLFNESAKGMDVLLGVGAGMVGVIGFKWALAKFKPAAMTLPPIVNQIAPLIGGALVGGLAYLVAKKTGVGRKFIGAKAPGLLMGAVATGAALSAHNLLSGTDWGKMNYQSYADLGIATDDTTPPSLSALVNEQYQLSEGEYEDDTSIELDGLAQMNMGEEDDDLEALLND